MAADRVAMPGQSSLPIERGSKMAKQKAARCINVGGIAGKMVIKAYNHLIQQKRNYALGLGTNEFEGLGFAEAHTPEGLRDNKHYVAMATRPEDYYWNLAIERVIVLSDTNPKRQPGERKVVGLVMFPCEESGSVKLTSGIWRLKVTLDAAYADNRNTYKYDWTVEEFRPAKPEDTVLAGAIADYDELDEFPSSIEEG